MMSICNENIVKQLLSDDIRRDYGLTNINNIITDVVMCVESVNGPLFTSNLTNLVSGMTETSDGVFNISNTGMTFDYTFTGNVSTLTAYTGSFNYEVYGRTTSRQTDLDTFNSEIVYTNSRTFSNITTSGFTLSDELTGLMGDQEYILNTNYSFIPNECTEDEIVVDGLGNISGDTTLYFVILTSPDTPILGPFAPITNPPPQILTVDTRDVDNVVPGNDETYVFGVPQAIAEDEDSSLNCQLITESLTINTVQADTFTLEYKPFDDSVMVSINGITLSTIDYTITDNVILTLSNTLDADRDLITVTYLACDRDLDSVTSEFYSITGITSGTTLAVTPEDKVYFNTEHSKYEYYVDNDFSSVEDTLLFINGLKLTYGLDYYQSITVDNKLIFNDATLSISDIIHVIYNIGDTVEGDYGIMDSDNTSLVWRTNNTTVVNDKINGEFTVEVTESSDRDFTTTATTQTIVGYVDGLSEYTSSIPVTLSANKNYIWRVTSDKTYTGLLDNIFTTSSVSKIGKFFTNNTINSY